MEKKSFPYIFLIKNVYRNDFFSIVTWMQVTIEDATIGSE